MAYSGSMYRKAQRILELRREKAFNESQERAQEIRNKIPEIDDIQKQLMGIGVELSQVVLFKGEAHKKVEELRCKSKALVAKRSEILKKNGFAEDAMRPHYICPACEDRGFINGRMCKCHHEVLKELMRKEIRKFAPLDDCTFDNFNLEYYSKEPLSNSIVPYNKAKLALEKSHSYAQNFSLSSSNLLFMGGPGLGKTHLSLAIANVVINKGFNVCYGTSQNICDDLQSEQFGRTDNISYTKQQVLDCDLLILDDLGTEIDNQYSVAIIYNIINSRILSKKPTIISTNYLFNSLEEKYDKRITSRINGEFNTFYLIGKDIRDM